MSATNHTVTVELSQYISTDKPTYLTDYNGDMLKIDNAIAADRDSISGVSTVANRADGKADTNKTNIDALNVQLNGDPEDPSDVGIAGDLNAVEGTVNTITSLIGSGSPTTSEQTIIGAINGLEGAMAPREDAANFANSYAIGAKFARGGSVYEALASIAAGTAFASLVLNTDYKVADTLVKQIEDAASGSGVIGAIVNSVEESIAPREDGTTLGASYSVGDQFIRAGVLYEALDSITAGDAFASLVLNTDYKVADTLVEQIANAGVTLPNGYYVKKVNDFVSVTANGVKTNRELLQELAGKLLEKAQALGDNELLVPTYASIIAPASVTEGYAFGNTATRVFYKFMGAHYDGSTSQFYTYEIAIDSQTAASNILYRAYFGNQTSTAADDATATVPTGGSYQVRYNVLAKF